MAEQKTKKRTASVSKFIATVDDPVKRRDAQLLCEMLERITGDKPGMWGPTMIGCGSYDLTGSNGKTTRWPVVAFSPRKATLVVYLKPEFPGRDALLAELGKHSTGKSCLYFKRLSDIDVTTLERLVKGSIAALKSR